MKGKKLDALTVTAVGMQEGLMRLNGISQNLANVTTAGYKRVVSFSEHMEGTSAVNRAMQTVVDTSAAPLRHTGNAMDVAIEGDAYFEVMTEGGPAYTRHGALHVDARGRLVNVQGYPVAGTGGELSVSANGVLIERNGDVKQGDRAVGQLKLVRFAHPERMAVLGNGLFGQGEAGTADANGGASPSWCSRTRSPGRMSPASRRSRSFSTAFRGSSGRAFSARTRTRHSRQATLPEA
ncbi:flagellar hook basal-body protein [Noviherbaspirillum sp.]|uniref:flagellar hook basal-body protein n=1 Tax=Noviherbaspirillum sp. TaxID=1926288 RepID=UPI002D667C0B|nr:flagellar hook basal-body protein [Noviherbaspirillum sp.]HZW21768.1 flagellar hook basal-body protein [Noviherbaspirillum sp.]